MIPKSNELNSIILLLESEDTFLVAKGHNFNPQVSAVIQRYRVQYEKRKFEIRTSSMEEISRRRSEGASEMSAIQKSVSDVHVIATALFKKAVGLKASDIHIQVSKQSTKVLFRVHGDLEPVQQETATWGQALCSTIYHSMADVSDPTFDENSRQDARIGNRSSLTEGLDGIRVATTPQVGGYCMILRLLYDAADSSEDLISLGFHPIQSAQIQLLKRRPTGLILISGPTGSGKSTTLKSALSSFIVETEGKKHVITVEDPPEYPIPGAIQTPVTNAPTEELRSIAFQLAIKGAMRVDPDVIMLGEIRDGPSARLAVDAAMTGHLVWSTVHANGAFPTIDRLVRLGIDSHLITNPSILSGLVSQRLLKALCSCKQPLLRANEKFRAKHPTFVQDVNRMMPVLDLSKVFVTGDGCPKCRNTGTIGRTVVTEVVVTDHTLLSLIRQGDTLGALAYWKKELQGITMLEHAIMKIEEGKVDPFAAEQIVGPLNFDRDQNIDHGARKVERDVDATTSNRYSGERVVGELAMVE